MGERLWLYRNTRRNPFPLILVFGREGNGEGEMDDFLGQYDFGLSPNSAFWNRAFGAVARLVGLAGAAKLKKVCDMADGSPIAFANCAPGFIPNRVTDKHSLREQQGGSAVEEHIGKVFARAEREVPGRIRLVILSVGDEFGFAALARGAITVHAQSLGVDWHELPYFGSRMTNDALDRSLPPSLRAQIVVIVGEFLNRAGKTTG